MYPISVLQTNPQRYTRGRTHPITMLVMHATAGSWPGDRDWLAQGGSATAPVSCHYIISPTGAIVRLVDEQHTAWHCGKSQWRLRDGTLLRDEECNASSVGIELSHRQRGEPYPAKQLAAATWLARQIVARYRIDRHDVVRHLDIAPGRKTDPAGLPWEDFVNGVYHELVFGEPYTAQTLLLDTSRPLLPINTIVNRIASRPTGAYTRYDVGVIVSAYYDVATACGIDPLLPIAQMLHETGNLTSFWAARPQRNPAGIGVNGEHSSVPPSPPTGWAWNDQRTRWERGLSFLDWALESVPAHVGRYLAYALPDEAMTAQQFDTARYALTVRPLPSALRGSAQTLEQLGARHNPTGQGWTMPGDQYGERIAAMANWLREG